VFNSYTGIGAWFMLRLLEEGHSVDYRYMGKIDKGNACLQGIVPDCFVGDCDYTKYDLSIFDLTGKAREAERSLQSTPTIGDSKLADELEDNRLFGIEIMEEAGINVPYYEVFSNIGTARTFISKTKKRYVFKPNGGQDQRAATTYVSTSYQDLLEYFDKLEEFTKGQEFILQEFVEGGTEISTEAYFNGEDFFLINATLEEKKFMNGNIGPNTGCAGNLVWAYRDVPKVFKEGLGRLREYLGEVNYRGMVDLNTIVTEGTLYGLEWTPRFGYDASATLFSLLPKGFFGEFLYKIAAGESVAHIEGLTSKKYAAAVRVSIPPYPFEELKHGLQQPDVPIGGIEPEELERFWLWDACLVENKLVTCGEGYGVIGCPIYMGDTPLEAFKNVYDRIKKLKIPDMQYRTDMTHYCTKRLDELDRMGWIHP
jgi:phosphoribosylamine---glycine ligase